MGWRIKIGHCHTDSIHEVMHTDMHAKTHRNTNTRTQITCTHARTRIRILTTVFVCSASCKTRHRRALLQLSDRWTFHKHKKKCYTIRSQVPKHFLSDGLGSRWFPLVQSLWFRRCWRSPEILSQAPSRSLRVPRHFCRWKHINVHFGEASLHRSVWMMRQEPSCACWSLSASYVCCTWDRFWMGRSLSVPSTSLVVCTDRICLIPSLLRSYVAMSSSGSCVWLIVVRVYTRGLNLMQGSSLHEVYAMVLNIALGRVHARVLSHWCVFLHECYALCKARHRANFLMTCELYISKPTRLRANASPTESWNHPDRNDLL